MTKAKAARPDKSSGDRPIRNEGEGSRSAANAYNRHATETAKSGHVQEDAKRAEAAREGAERTELERAEREGRAHAKGEDPEADRQQRDRR